MLHASCKISYVDRVVDIHAHTVGMAVLNDAMAILLEATPIGALAVSHAEGRWDLLDPDGRLVASFARPDDLEFFTRAPAALRLLATALAQVSLAHRAPAGETCPTDAQPVPCPTARLLSAYLERHDGCH